MMSNAWKLFQCPQAATLAARLASPRRFMPVVTGPRQLGKTAQLLACDYLPISSVAAGIQEDPAQFRKWARRIVEPANAALYPATPARVLAHT